MTPEILINRIATYYGYTYTELQGISREGFPECRHVVFFELKKRFPKKSLEKIGEYLNKDHSTVLFAIRKVSGWLEVDKDFIKKYEKIQIHLNKANNWPTYRPVYIPVFRQETKKAYQKVHFNRVYVR